jgi:hypothetical protein
MSHDIWGEALCWHDAWDPGTSEHATLEEHDQAFFEKCESFMLEGPGASSIPDFEIGTYFTLTRGEIEEWIEIGTAGEASLSGNLPPEFDFPEVFCCHVPVSETCDRQMHEYRDDFSGYWNEDIASYAADQCWTEHYRGLGFGMNFE